MAGVILGHGTVATPLARLLIPLVIALSLAAAIAVVFGRLRVAALAAAAVLLIAVRLMASPIHPHGNALLAEPACRNPEPRVSAEVRPYVLPAPPKGFMLARVRGVPAPSAGRPCWVQHLRVRTSDGSVAPAALYSFAGANGPRPPELAGPGAAATNVGTQRVWMRLGRDPQTGMLIATAAWSNGPVDVLLRTADFEAAEVRRLIASVALVPQATGGGAELFAVTTDGAVTVVFEGHPVDLPTEGVMKTMVVYSRPGPLERRSASEVVATSLDQVVVHTWRGQAFSVKALVAGQQADPVEVNGRQGYVFTAGLPAFDGAPRETAIARTVLVFQPEEAVVNVLDSSSMDGATLLELAQRLTLA